MTEYFKHVRGGFTLYCHGDSGDIADVRYVLGIFGEDPAKILEAFWQERTGDFLVVPLFAYGGVPRRQLSSQQSLTAALQSVTIEPGGFVEMKWKELCQQMSVAWPKRLQGKAA